MNNLSLSFCDMFRYSILSFAKMLPKKFTLTKVIMYIYFITNIVIVTYENYIHNINLLIRKTIFEVDLFYNVY